MKVRETIPAFQSKTRNRANDYGFLIDIDIRGIKVTKTNSSTKHPRVKDTETFIAAAKMTHGERYDYSKTSYKNAKTKVTVTCSQHGDFIQCPRNHVKGANCPQCGKADRGKYYESVRKEASKTFVDRAIDMHGKKYGYSLVEYYNSNSKVKILCGKHGVFTQSPHEHLSGAGCPACARVRVSEAVEGRRLKAARGFKDKAKAVHGSKYDYARVKYVNSHAKVEILCPYHGIFTQSPSGHLSGKGCFECGREFSTGWNRTDFVKYANAKSKGVAILYLIKCWSGSEVFYKIGITTTTVEERFKRPASMPYEFKTLHTVTGSAGFIYDAETQFHRMNKSHKYRPTRPFDGSVLECFSEITEDALFLLDVI